MIGLLTQKYEIKLVLRKTFQVAYIQTYVKTWRSRSLAKNFLLWLILPWVVVLQTRGVQAQSIVPAPDGTGTIVTPDGDGIDISGGQLSGDKANLFHSFTQFGLNPEQIANFLSNPNIQNILGRVVGGDPSVIRGLIQVTGGNSNLFLVNPSGIIFAPTANLNVPGAFTATTANGIGFGSNWFNASGVNNYAALVGNPNTFSFSMSQPGAIINASNLTVGQGQNLTLLGGTVANTGSLSAPGGQIIVSAVPGEKLVRLSQPGSPLSLEILPLPTNGTQAQTWNLPIASLPQLLTAGGGGNASRLTVNNDGSIQISGSGIPIIAGDVVTGNVTAKTATITANRNLTSVESQLHTTEDLNLLAKNTVQIRDSVANPFVARAGGNLLIQGNQNIDILALNHPETPFQSNGNLSLVSDGIISGDAHFASGGNFSLLDLAGNPGKFVSLYDPIIRANGNVSFGTYTGAALKVETTGDIVATGDITITGPDTQLPTSETDSDASLLRDSSALILRAGLPSVSSPSTFPVSTGNTTFTSTGTPSSGSITVNGNIDTSSSGNGGPIILSARGNINTNNINSSGSDGNGGLINITSNTGNITVGNLTSSAEFGTGGAIALDAAGNITTNVIRTGPDGGTSNADVNITSRNGSISINSPDNDGNSIVGRSITINTPSTLLVTGGLNARSDGEGNSGNVIIGNTLVPSSIAVGTISTRNRGNDGGGGGNINIITSGTFNATRVFSRSTGLPVNPTASDGISIASEAFSDNGGIINITANGGISTVAGIASNSRASGNGGDIILTSNNGAINTGFVDSSSTNGTGGAIALNANNIIVGNIVDTSGFLRGGAVTLTSSNDVIFNSINTQGTYSLSSNGGNVNITANGVVRGIGSANTTIFTQGTTPGTIRIQHDGGPNNAPFVVGNATFNGTAGAIDAGNGSRISPTTSFPVLPNGGDATGVPARITINSVNSPPTATQTLQLLPNGQRNQPYILTNNSSANLETILETILAARLRESGSVNDVNRDNITVRIDSIVGRIRINGTEVDPRLQEISVSPSDQVEYIPPPNTVGNISAFTVRASDGVSFSQPVTINVNFVNNPPSLTANSSLSGARANQPFPISFGTLNPVVQDADNDLSTIRVDSITAGTLRINGNVVVPGTESAILPLGASLEYIPPANAVGNVPAFALSASDGVAFSQPVTISININSNNPPSLTANSPLSGARANQPFPIAFGTLNPVAQDADNDPTTIRVDRISAGTLRINGNDVVPGTESAILPLGASLEYIPPANFLGNVDAFTLSASDGILSSGQVPIAVNIALPTIPQDDVGNIQKITTPPVLPQIPNTGIPPRLAVLDLAIAGVDDRFTQQFQSYLGQQPREVRRRLTLYETREVLRRIEKATGVKPAIIYVTFVPSGATSSTLQTEQDTDQLELMVVTATGEPIYKRVPVAKRSQVRQVADEFRLAASDPVTDESDYLPLGKQLHEWMVTPLEADLKAQGINNLLFITDVSLRSLPLAALHDGKQFLVEKYSVGFTPSLSLTDTRYVDIKNSQVLAMGASQFQDQGSLPAVPLELSIVAKDIWRGKLFLNHTFTLRNLKTVHKTQPFGIIHLATHGEFTKGKAENSFIQLWDNKLRLNQFRELELNSPAVELLVLSACRTALGDKDAELGFGGLAAQAGVKTAVASLWQVSDAGTLGLMTEFYKNLRTAPIKAEALRLAQVAMLRKQVSLKNGQLLTSARGVNLPSESPEATQNKTLQHPYYWAAFTMIGNPW